MNKHPKHRLRPLNWAYPDKIDLEATAVHLVIKRDPVLVRPVLKPVFSHHRPKGRFGKINPHPKRVRRSSRNVRDPGAALPAIKM